jgi:hypothetical protein
MLCLKLKQQKDPVVTKEAIRYVERSRSRAFLDQLALTRVQVPIGDDMVATPIDYEGMKLCLQSA